MVICKCLFLDGREVDVTISKDATGAALFRSVCSYQGISEPGYFGLVLRAGSDAPPHNWWVRPEKPLRGQIKGKAKVWAFAFVLKFYPQPQHLGALGNESTRFNTVQQLRQDLLTNRLRCPTSTRALLASYWLQSEYGDYVSKNVDFQLVEAFRFVRRGKNSHEGDIDFEEQMIELHRCLRGMTSSKADKKFLLLAASLQNYGVHFYPAFKSAQQTNKRPQASGIGIMFGVGPTGISLLQERKPVVTYKWNDVRAIAFKHNAVTIKFNETKERKPGPMTYAFDDVTQAKNVWKTAAEFHVHFRVQKSSPRVRTSPGAATPATSRPQLSAVDETRPKSVGSSRRAPGSNPSVPASPASRASKNSPRAPTNGEQTPRGPSPGGAARNSSPETLRYDDQAQRSSIVSLSDVTDDTDVLCSKKMIDRAFPEDDGITSVTSWLRNNERGRAKSRSAPGSQRASSRGRSQLNDSDADDIDDYKPLIPSRRPLVVRARDLRDLSPPLTVHYEDEPARRPSRYKSADNVRRTWSRESSPAGVLQRRYHDIYRRELMNNLSTSDPYRRSKSLHSLGPKRHSLYCDHCMTTLTPSTVSANASSGSHRSLDFLEIEDNRLPVESSFTKRILSESRLARNRPRLTRLDRGHVTSWTGGDYGYLNQRERKPVRRFKDSIPEMPKFFRSVR